MPSLLSRWRSGLAAVLLTFVAAPVFAEDATAPTEDPVAEEAPAPVDDAIVAEAPWQEVITGQIQAFREHDAPVALSYAAQAFKTNYPDPQVFFVAIIGGGYAPIMESRAHSFGEYELVGKDTVVQLVRLTGTDQQRYEAVYQLGKEEAGWRVQAVQLAKVAGIGI